MVKIPKDGKVVRIRPENLEFLNRFSPEPNTAIALLKHDDELRHGVLPVTVKLDEPIITRIVKEAVEVALEPFTSR